MLAAVYTLSQDFEQVAFAVVNDFFFLKSEGKRRQSLAGVKFEIYKTYSED